jgi:hypothetical protein
MSVTYSDFPGWEFTIIERSLGVYEVNAIDAVGHQVSLEGTDPYELLERAKADVHRIRRVLHAPSEE